MGVSAGETIELEGLNAIKSILEVLDDTPVINPSHQALIKFASDYYLAPPGDLLLSSLPTSIRKGKPFPLAKTEQGQSQPPDYPLTDEQQDAIDFVNQASDDFQCFLLQGVTGSGKTQVFSELIRKTLERGKQVLLLVPEIGLTGQMVARIQQQLTGTLAVSHSGLADGARAEAFVAASQGTADVLIGTRSAFVHADAKSGAHFGG